MKKIQFLGDSLDDIKSFPKKVIHEIGYQLYRIQSGLEPNNWKPISTVGIGVLEIRIREDSGTFRVFYVAKKSNTVTVLHAFRKTTQKTEKCDIEQAKKRFKQLE